MKLTIASVLAAAGLALAHPASAGITCNLADQRGNALQYSFAHGGNGYTNETVVKRNGVVLSNGGPMWTRSFNSAERTMTLQQGAWSLVYEAKPHDTDISRAGLFINSTQKATGTCVVDYSVDAPAPSSPTIEASAPPAQAYTAPAPATNSGGIMVTADGRTPFVRVHFGHWQPDMVIDTGATGMAVNAGLAANLVQQGDAHYVDEVRTATIADGSTVSERVIVIDNVMVGSHVVHNVRAGVTQGDNLLPFPIIVEMGLLVPGARS